MANHAADHERAKLKREVKQGRAGAQEDLERLRTGAKSSSFVPGAGHVHWQAKLSRSTHKERKLFHEEHKKHDKEEEARRQEEASRQEEDRRQREEEAKRQDGGKKQAKEDTKGGKKAAKEVEMEPDSELSEFQAKAAERDRKMKEAAIAAKLEVERQRREDEERKALEERHRLALKRRAVMLPRLEAKVRRDMVRMPLEAWAAYKRDKQHGSTVVSGFAHAHKQRVWFRTLRNLARDRKHRNGVEAAFTRSVNLSLLCEHIGAWSTLARLTRPLRPAGVWSLQNAAMPAPLPVDSAEFQPAWPLADPGQAHAMISERAAQLQADLHHEPQIGAEAHRPHHAIGFQQALQQPPPPSAEELQRSALEFAAARLTEGRGLARAGCTLDALECFEDALQRRVEALGDEHPSCVEALYECGLVCPDKERAVGLLKRCVAIEEKTRGELHSETGQCMLGAGMALVENGSEAEALWMLARAAAAFEASVGKQDARFKRAVNAMLDIM